MCTTLCSVSTKYKTGEATAVEQAGLTLTVR